MLLWATRLLLRCTGMFSAWRGSAHIVSSHVPFFSFPSFFFFFPFPPLLLPPLDILIEENLSAPPPLFKRQQGQLSYSILLVSGIYHRDLISFTLQNDPYRSLVTICHCMKLLQYYWLYSLCSTLYPHNLFIL